MGRPEAVFYSVISVSCAGGFVGFFYIVARYA